MNFRNPSKRESVIFILVFLTLGTAAIESFSLLIPETIYGGFHTVESRILPNCDSIYSVMNRSLFSWYLVCLSDDLGNPRLIPFVFSIGLIPLTFLFVRQATESDTISLFSAAGLVINPIYLIFDDSAAYHQFWVFFSILSLYMAYRKPVLAAPIMLVAIIAKPAALFFVPVLFVIAYPNRVHLSFAAILVIFVTVYAALGRTELVHGSFTQFDPDGLQTISWSFTKHIGWFFVIPVIAGIILWQSRLSLMLLASLVTYIFAASFTTAAIFPYHMIPVIILVNASLASFIVNRTRRNIPRPFFTLNDPPDKILNTIYSNPEQCAKNTTCLTSCHAKST